MDDLNLCQLRHFDAARQLGRQEAGAVVLPRALGTGERYGKRGMSV